MVLNRGDGHKREGGDIEKRGNSKNIKTSKIIERRIPKNIERGLGIGWILRKHFEKDSKERQN